jgi:hypothetical protein
MGRGAIAQRKRAMGEEKIKLGPENNLADSWAGIILNNIEIMSPNWRILKSIIPNIEYSLDERRFFIKEKFKTINITA